MAAVISTYMSQLPKSHHWQIPTACLPWMLVQVLNIFLSLTTYSASM
ncbi:hypothetical protein [Salmonirosea aquatica]